MNSHYEQFQWCLRFVRSICQNLHQDIFVRDYRYKTGYFVTIAIFLLMLINYGYTIGFHANGNDIHLIMVSPAYLCAAIQVQIIN